MTRHVSAEKLARFRGGGLRRAAARRVRRHLDDCSRCRETEADLAAVPELLAAVEAPQIPAHLAARIETALATEAAHRAAGSPSMRSAAGRPSPAAHRRSRPALPGPALRVLTAAAVIVVIGGGGFELFSHLGGASSGVSSSSGSAAEPFNGTARPAPRASAMAPSAARAAPTLGPAVQYRRDGQLATVRPVRTATNYQPAQLAAQVRGTLARTTRVPRLGGTSGTAGFGVAQLSQLAGCVSRVAAGHDVLLVDVARFRGTPATVIVTAAQGVATGSATGGTTEQIWVVGEQCSRSGSDVLTRQPLPG